MVSLSQNASQVSTSCTTNSTFSMKTGIEVNKKLKGENDTLNERIKELERRGKETQFNYAKDHIDVASFITNVKAVDLDLENRRRGRDLQVQI